MTNSQKFDEVLVFEGVAERTGKTLDRSTVRGSDAVCRSVSELMRKVRRVGDGYFYLPVLAWPEGVTKLELFTAWQTMG